MTKIDLEKIVQFIISESVNLKNKYTKEINAKVEYCDIFSQDGEEYQRLTEIVNECGKIAHSGPTGNIYSLTEPIKTVAGDLYFLKIRKPDNKLRFRGDADFDTNYQKLKQKHLNNPNFELIIREKFEMLRLSDPDFDVMTCFSNIPVRKWV